MTQSECTSEVNFRLCKSVFATLAAQGIISQKDVRRLIRAAAEQYHAPQRVKKVFLTRWSRGCLKMIF